MKETLKDQIPFSGSVISRALKYKIEKYHKILKNEIKRVHIKGNNFIIILWIM